jgi:hypothetical protein
MLCNSGMGSFRCFINNRNLQRTFLNRKDKTIIGVILILVVALAVIPMTMDV